MLRTKTFEVVETDETFLGLAIGSREVTLLLGFPSSDAESPLGLGGNEFDREGVGQDICNVPDEETFALFHQMADA